MCTNWTLSTGGTTLQVLEALQHGLVVVTTAVGIEGIASAESFPGYVATAQVRDGMGDVSQKWGMKHKVVPPKL